MVEPVHLWKYGALDHAVALENCKENTKFQSVGEFFDSVEYGHLRVLRCIGVSREIIIPTITI